MASPQKENGYTAIANELMEAFCKYSFPPKASVPPRLVLFVIRKTYGYHKKDDIISISQFQSAIGEKNRSNVVYWLNYLVQARVLVKDKISNMQVKYGLNKDYEQWLPLVQVKKLVQVRHWGSASNDTETSARKDTHKRNKEITKETSKTSVLQGTQWNELIDSFKEINPSYTEFYANKTERAALEKMVSMWGYEKTLRTIQELPKLIGQPYAPKITKPTELKRDIGKLIAFYQQEKSKITSKKKFIT